MSAGILATLYWFPLGGFTVNLSRLGTAFWYINYINFRLQSCGLQCCGMPATRDCIVMVIFAALSFDRKKQLDLPVPLHHEVARVAGFFVELATGVLLFQRGQVPGWSNFGNRRRC